MKNITKALVVLLCLVLVAFSVISCGKDPKETTAPDTTAPEVTTPEETTPEVTTPEETDPEVTTPEETLPDETLPDETLPDETLPAETTPAETTPAETKPAETTKPAEDHKHNYQLVVSNPTCDADGVKTYICDCGDSYTEAGEPALGHSLKHIEENDVAPTCLVEGYESYECVVCGQTEIRSLGFAPHTFTVSTQLVTAAEEPLGKGYEILACAVEGCKSLSKVTANHETGHNFVLVEGTTYACACGQTAQQKIENIGLVDFEATDSATGISFGGLTSSNLVDGKVVVSLYAGQTGMPATAKILEVLGGTYNGAAIDTFRLSWEYSYTGDPSNISGGQLNWRYTPAGASYKEFTISVSRSGGKLTVDGAVLEPETAYTLALEFVPSKNTVVLTIEGGEYTERTEISKKNLPMAMTEFSMFFMTRSALYCADPSAFALYMDNLSADVVLLSPDADAEVNSKPCDHAFGEPTPYFDLTHTVDQMWLRQTCEKCGGYFESRNCEGLGYHTWLPNPIADRTVASTCTEKGSEYYECLYCDAIDVRRLATLPHQWGDLIADKAIAPTCDQTGVNYRACVLCGEEKVESVAALGHKWEEKVVLEHNCVQSGKIEKTCTVCGETEQVLVLPEHNYLVFEGVVAKADDPRAIGYEMWSCPGCGRIEKIYGNHETGHTFDATGKCACGAKTFEEKTDIGTATEKLVTTTITPDGQVGLRVSNQSYKEALAGSYNGEVVDFAALSMFLTWEGDTANCVNTRGNRGSYLMWRFNEGTAQAVNVGLDVSGEEPKLYYGSKEIALKEGVKHELRFYADLASQTVTVQVTPEGGETVVLGSQTVTLLDKTWMLYVDGGRVGDCPDTSLYKMELENLHMEVIELLPDESEMTTVACDHEFVGAPSDEAEFPGIYGWTKFSCECGKFYLVLGCEEAGHHTWAAEPNAEKTVEPSCFAVGYEYYPCAYCDAEDVREIKMIPHVFATEPDAALTVPAKCEQSGMEYYPCTNEGCVAYDEKELEALEHDWVESEKVQGDCTKEGYITYTCQNECGTPKTETLPMECAYINFGGVVSAEDDPRGVGYELWSCPGCGEAKKIAGNHESGHFFEDNKCVCGAKLVPNQVNVAFDDFSGDATITVGNRPIVNGELAISKVNSQGMNFTTNANNTNVGFYNLYRSGKAEDGSAVDKLLLSFDIKYTGTNLSFINGYGSAFTSGTFNWRCPHDSGYKDEFTVGLGKDGNQLSINVSGRNFTKLTAGEAHRFVVEIDPNAKTYALYIDGKLLGEFAPQYYDNFSVFYLSRKEFYCENESEFLLTADNMSIDYISGLVVDESEMVEPICVHEFEYTAEGDVATLECYNCDVFYTEESCAVLGHATADEPYISEVTCKGGTETYACLVCGADVVRDVEPGSHVYETYVSTTATEGDVAGYETWQCKWCEETKKIEGNHESGHFFTDKACACGALLTDKVTTVAKAINGEVCVSKTKADGQTSYSVSAAAYKDVLGGSYNGKTVDYARLSLTVRWTGDTAEAVNTRNSKHSEYISWRFDSDYKPTKRMDIGIDVTGEKVVLTYGTTKATLEKNVTYTLAFDSDIAANEITAKIIAPNGDVTVLGTIVPVVKLATTTSVFVNGGRFGDCPDENKFAIYLGDLGLGILEEEVVEP